MKRDVAALLAFIDGRHKVPHAWGRKKNDCVSFAFGAVKAQTGKDPGRGLKWTNEENGRKLLDELGGIEAAFDARFDRIAPAFAKRGDIAGVTDKELGLHPMVVEGMTLVAPGETGNRRCDRRHMKVAWDATSVKKP